MNEKVRLEVLSLLVAVGAAAVAALKARAANRSAKAADRSAQSAERNYLLSERKLGLDLAVLKERWVEKLAVAFKNDGHRKTLVLLPRIPDELRPQGLEVLDLVVQGEAKTGTVPRAVGWVCGTVPAFARALNRKRETRIPLRAKALAGQPLRRAAVWVGRSIMRGEQSQKKKRSRGGERRPGDSICVGGTQLFHQQRQCSSRSVGRIIAIVGGIQALLRKKP